MYRRHHLKQWVCVCVCFLLQAVSIWCVCVFFLCVCDSWMSRAVNEPNIQTKKANDPLSGRMSWLWDGVVISHCPGRHPPRHPLICVPSPRPIICPLVFISPFMAAAPLSPISSCSHFLHVGFIYTNRQELAALQTPASLSLTEHS